MTIQGSGEEDWREREICSYLHLPSCPRFRHVFLIFPSLIFPMFLLIAKSAFKQSIETFSNTTPKIGMRSRTEDIWMSCRFVCCARKRRNERERKWERGKHIQYWYHHTGDRPVVHGTANFDCLWHTRYAV